VASIHPPASAADDEARFVRAAPGKVTYPWQEPHVRSDLKIEVNTRQPEDVILQIHFLAAETGRSKREVIEEALRRYASEELRRLGIER
jgi:hypothetical protein